MSARDKAEKTYRQEHRLKMPSAKQMEMAIKMGADAPCYKQKYIAWEYPGEIYQSGHELVIPEQIMAILERENKRYSKTKKTKKKGQD